MDWDKLGQQWREQSAAGGLAPLDVLRERDRALWRKVWRRDLLETVAAVFVAACFAVAAVVALGRAEWLVAAWALLLVAWAAYVPFRLRSARRLAREPGPDMPLLAFLEQQREAMFAQARMLERVWAWYLGPPAIGLAGFMFSVRGVTPRSLAYVGVMLAFCVVIAWLNRYAARNEFGERARALQAAIDRLREGDA